MSDQLVICFTLMCHFMNDATIKLLVFNVDRALGPQSLTQP